MAENKNGWSEYEVYVIETLKDLKKGQEALMQEVSDLKVEVGKLQVKAGIIGAMAGVVVSMIVALVELVLRSKS